MPLAGQDKQVEALVGPYEGVHYADGVGRVHVVVHVAGHQHKVTLEA